MDATQTVSAATCTGKVPKRGPSSAAAVNGVMLGLMGIMFGLSIVYLISRIVSMSRRVSQLERQVKEAEGKAAPDEQGIAAIIQGQLNSAIERALQDEPDIPACPRAPPPSPEDNHRHHRMQHRQAEMDMLSPPPGVMDMLMHDIMGGSMPGVMMMGMPHTHAHPPRPVSGGGASIVEILDDDDEQNVKVEVEDGFDVNVDDEETTIAQVPIPIADATRDDITEDVSKAEEEEVEVEEAVAEAASGGEAKTEFKEGVHDGGESDNSDAAVSWITSAMAPIADVVTALQDMEAEDAKRRLEEVEKRAKPVTRRITRSRRTGAE
jgi:hypothetical protein